MENKTLFSTVDVAIKADLKALKEQSSIEAKLEGAEVKVFDSVKEVIRSSKDLLSDQQTFDKLKAHVKELYKGNASDSVMRKRITLLAGARMVAFGGTAGSKARGTLKTVRGFGWDRVEEVLTEAKGINNLSALLTAAKPEALQNPAKSNTTGNGLAANQAADRLPGEPTVADRETAETVAIEALERLAAFLTQDESDLKLLTAVNAVKSMILADAEESAKAELEAE